MARGAKETVKFRRERELKTDYRARLALLKSRTARLVVRISNKNVVCQLIVHEEKGDKVLASGSSKELQKMGWKSARANTPAAYLTGYLCGKKGKKSGVESAILDLGFQTVVKGSKLFAALKGAVDAGVEIPHDAGILPSADRLEGKHISEAMKAQVAETKKKIDALK
jgi:large subunit ribosomal protein L18